MNTRADVDHEIVELARRLETADRDEQLGAFRHGLCGVVQDTLRRLGIVGWRDTWPPDSELAAMYAATVADLLACASSVGLVRQHFFCYWNPHPLDPGGIELRMEALREYVRRLDAAGVGPADG